MSNYSSSSQHSPSAALVALVAVATATSSAFFVWKQRKKRQERNNKDAAIMPPLSILEFEREAKRTCSPLADIYFNYIDGEGVTVKACRQFLHSIRLVPRILQGDLSKIDTCLTLFGQKLELPVLIAPTAFHDLACPDEGEVATARGSGRAGVGYCYNWMLAAKGYREVIGEPGVKWLHIYMFEEKDMVSESIRLAEQSGAFGAVILSCDHPHTRVQNRMVPNFMKLMDLPKRGTPEASRYMFPNQAAAGGCQLTVEQMLMEQSIDTSGTNSDKLSWEDVKWIKSLTSLPVVVKGILSPLDASIAVEVGASAIVVSNHGCRQFDGAPPAIEVLPSIVAAVDGKIPILVDSGFRASTDIVKALCLGADAVLLGRPALWALSCGGADGLHTMLNHLQNDIANDMRSLGAKSIKELDTSFVYPPDLERIEQNVASCMPMAPSPIVTAKEAMEAPDMMMGDDYIVETLELLSELETSAYT